MEVSYQSSGDKLDKTMRDHMARGQISQSFKLSAYCHIGVYVRYVV